MEQTSELAPDAMKRATQKLNEIMRNGATRGSEQLLNERGEPLNEEGLPIVEIAEPISATVSEDTRDAFIPEDVPSISLHNLTPQERDRLRQERDRILDQLEEEEETFGRQGRRLGFEEKQEILRKRKEAAAHAKEKLQAAKSTQKKMGKALLRTMSAQADNAESSGTGDATQLSQDEKLSKKVAFADDLENHSSESLSPPSNASVDWGDLTPGRLRSTPQPSLLSSSEKLPMKMVVVERQTQTSLKIAKAKEADSDDESNPESPEHETANEGDSSEQEYSLEDEEFDLDTAQHQREVALEYYAKRENFRAAALEATSLDTDKGTKISAEAPSTLPPKTGLSQFKASRLASSYSVTDRPQRDNTVSSSATQILQKSIRIGKLDANDQLIGGDSDSVSEGEYDESTQEIIKTLKGDESYNVGPDGKLIHTVSTSTTDHLPPTSYETLNTSGFPFKNLPVRDKPKMSKFKLSRAKAGRPSDADATSSGRAPVSKHGPTPHPDHEAHVPRSVTTTSSEGQQSIPHVAPAVNSNVLKDYPVATANINNSFPSMIVESPSFPHPTHLSAGFTMSNGTSANVTHPERSSRPLRPPAVISTVRETIPDVRTSSATQTQPAKAEKVSRFMAGRR